MSLSDDFVGGIPDTDPAETREWIESLDAVASAKGRARAEFLMQKLLERSHELQYGIPAPVRTPYINTIPADEQRLRYWFPGDHLMEQRIRAYIRWNAAVMVIKANKAADGIGGHLATYASSASLYEVGFNHFFRGKAGGRAGDAVYIQGHAAPGIYARAFLEHRLDEGNLDRFRRELGGTGGLSSYPHPRLMPDFWEYPTVSMGLAPISSIYQARFNRYLHARRIDATDETRVWCFVGDGETDEPETLGAIALAGREGLDNLTWVVNCNLQRLDGPVRGNGKIIQELEAVFRGAGWNVVKVIWGSRWDELISRDVDGVLLDKMNTTVDGDFQRYAVSDGAHIRDHFFGPDPRLRALVDDLTDEELRALPRGGHDYQKLYAAYRAATEQRGAPTVILAKTIKGWTLGEGVEARNATHQIKKMTMTQLRSLRERLHLHDEIPEAALADDAEPPYYRPEVGSAMHTYLMERREALGGSLPHRVVRVTRPLELPPDDAFAELLAGSGRNEASTTTAFTRLLRALARTEGFGRRIVPIIPDEARTFGMDSLFKEFGIYAAHGQKYEPVDHALLLSYTETVDGQLLEEGITEAGSLASWTAAATSYATRGVPMVPFFIFYSMFGFQRVGDLIWQASDHRAKGFLLGATAGRTTLLGEGLQHQDGHSHVLASTVPVCRAYDPAFAYEVAALVRHGIHDMYGPDGNDVFYYLTLYNENHVMPPMPEGAVDGIVEGLYRWRGPLDEGATPAASVLFSGTAHLAATAAQADLAEHHGVHVDLWSAPGWKQLREQALGVERWNRLHPTEAARTARVTELLGTSDAPVVAVTDFMASVPDQVARWVRRPWSSLGTDGFGRSDTREALRGFFETDAGHVVVAVLSALARAGAVDPSVPAKAAARHGIDPDVAPSWQR